MRDATEDELEATMAMQDQAPIPAAVLSELVEAHKSVAHGAIEAAPSDSPAVRRGPIDLQPLEGLGVEPYCSDLRIRR
jgi:hypothetical protein